MGSYAMDKVGGLQEARDKPEQILQSNTDAEAWNLEVERVAPQLKVDILYVYHSNNQSDLKYMEIILIFMN